MPPTEPPKTALVLFSGGQDSTVCLADALTRFEHVETIGFDYGQRNRVELVQRPVVIHHLRQAFPAWSARLGADHQLEIPTLGRMSDTSLTRETAIAMLPTGLPNTFVPGRNLLLFAYAAALAYGRGITTLVGGMCETDYSGYPDCRHETLQALARALSLGLGRPITIDTPLMWIDKAGTWALAQRLGGAALVEIVRAHTHSCYLGDRTGEHAWGRGCGTCPACELRRHGWERWRDLCASAAG